MNYKYRIFFFSIIFFLFLFLEHSNLFAQPTILGRFRKLENPENYLITSWNSSNGLPQNSVNRIAKDKKGFLWLATMGGLVRFDGVNFKIYNVKEYPMLRTDRIIEVLVDRDDRIWIANDQGNLLVLANNRMIDYTHYFDQICTFILPKIEDSLGNIYFFTDKNVYYFSNSKMDKIQLAGNISEGFDSHFFENLTVHRDTLIVCTKNYLSLIYRGKELKSQKKSKILSEVFNSFINNEGIWFNHQGQLKFASSFDKLDNAVTLFPEKSFASIFVDDNVKLGLLNNGSLIEFTKNGFETITRETNTEIFGTAAFLVINPGNFYIGSQVNGLFHIKRKFLYTVDATFGLKYQNQYPVFRSKNNSIWFGQNPGLYQLTDTGLISYGFSKEMRSAWGITEDNSGNIWIAANGSYIHKYDGRRFTEYNRDSIPGIPGTFLSAYTDSRGRQWFGSLGIIVSHDSTGFKVYEPLKDQKYHFNNFLEDQNGRLWIASSAGLFYFEKGAFTFVKEANAVSARNLYFDCKERLWIGTYGNGITIRINDRYYHITEKQGLFSNIVSAVTEDKKGNFWFTSNNGLFRVKNKEIDKYFEEKIQRIHCISYGVNDGLDNIEFNGGCQPSWMQDLDGNLWFPSFNGPIVVDPDKLPEMPIEPNIVIDNIEWKDSVLYDYDDILLPPDYGKFTINFASPSFSSPGAVTFKYRIKELDKDWIEAGINRSVTYQKLGFGNFTFEVIAENYDGLKSKMPAMVKLSIDSRFIDTPYFYLVIFISLFMLAIIVFIYKLRNEKKKEEELQKIVDDRTLSLKIAKETAELLAQEERELRAKAEEENRQKNEILRIVSHDLKNPVFAVQGFAEFLMEDEALSEDAKASIQMIGESGERMKELIEQILAYSRFESGNIFIHAEVVDSKTELTDIITSFKLRSVKKNQELKFFANIKNDSKIYTDKLIFRAIFENLISNAIKYSGTAKEIVVTLSEDDEVIEVSVKDFGPGFSAEDLKKIFKPFTKLSALPTAGESSTGLGLSAVKKYVEMVSANLELITSTSNGAEFKVRFPRSL
ncbi:MAG: hypothetical protein K9I71_01940 [Ignavibacteriales bacterium]|nr:hypothetical protein [Ignavibacteriales bacterium]MCF8314850.1 hypothetical protein [Ignavibacteriales bacterium]MCF8436201.1 hypothetical protein [Ignavibacteriales bacterium]